MALKDAAPFAVAAWPFDEDFTDQVGDNDLAENNGPIALVPGKLGNAADFESSSSQFLSIADNDDVSMGDFDWMIRAWVNAETVISNASNIISKGSDVRLGVQIGRFSFVAGGVSIIHVAAGTVSPGTWYLLHAWHDSTNSIVGISVNVIVATASAGAVNENDSDLVIGSSWDGLIDDPLIMKDRFLDSDEIDEDINNGDGVPFANWKPPVPPDPYRPLKVEFSGTLHIRISEADELRSRVESEPTRSARTESSDELRKRVESVPTRRRRPGRAT